MIFYLAYGSNLHPGRIRQRIGRADCVGLVELSGWRLNFDKRGADGSAKANLCPVPGSTESAWAAVFDVADAAIPQLDRYEGAGGGYETFRFEVTVEGRPEIALAYLTPSQWVARHMRPYDWYRGLVAAGARHHRLPQDYVQRIEQVPAITDPDTERAQRMHELLASLIT